MKKTLTCLAASSALFIVLAGPIPAPDSLVAPAETDTLSEISLDIFPPEGILVPYSYQLDWGDGTVSDWTEPLRAHYEAQHWHRYTSLGEVEIRVRVRDSLQRVSDWSRPLPVLVTEPRLKWLFQTFDPVVATPALDRDGNIYIGDDTGWFYSVTADGVLRWGYETDGAIFAAAMLDDKHVYFGSLDSHVYCLDRDGRLVWKQHVGDEVYAPAALDTRGNLYVTTDAGRLVALRSSRRLPLFGRRVIWRTEAGAELTGSPTITADGGIVVAAESVHCYEPGGRRRWSFGTAAEEFFFASPIVDGAGNLYVGGTEGRVYALGPDGRLLWQASVPDEDAVLTELIAGPGGAFWFGTELGYLCRLEPPAGTAGARVRTVYETIDLIAGAVAVSDKGTVYFVSEDGYFYAFRADGRPLWRYELAEGDKDTYYTSAPTIGPDGTVYIGSWEGGLYAFRGDGPPARTFWPQYRRDAANTGRLAP